MAIHRIKTAYCIGVGEGITTEKETLLTRRVILTVNRTGLPVDRLQCNQLEVLSMFKQAPTTQLQWEGDRGSFMQQCVEMVNEWSPRIPFTVDHNTDFGNHQER